MSQNCFECCLHASVQLSFLLGGVLLLKLKTHSHHFLYETNPNRSFDLTPVWPQLILFLFSEE